MYKDAFYDEQIVSRHPGLVFLIDTDGLTPSVRTRPESKEYGDTL